MDSVYKFEAAAIVAAAQADAGKFTQAEYVAQVDAAVLQMNAELAERSREQSLAAQAENQRQAEIAAQNRENTRRALLGEYLQNGGFHPAPTLQPCMMPTQPPGTNCTTNYVGNQAYTHCQ
jgi:hypothetical protein